jgi:hypothetical protein
MKNKLQSKQSKISQNHFCAIQKIEKYKDRRFLNEEKMKIIGIRSMYNMVFNSEAEDNF